LSSPTLADEIHKHDGSILTGKIIETILNELYKIQLAGGSILVIKPEEVKKIVFSSTEAAEAEMPIPSIDTSSKTYKRYHIGYQVDFNYEVLSDNFAFDFNGSHLDFDLTNALLETYNFRYSLTPVVSLVIDFRTWLLGGGTIDLPAVDLGSSFFGIGIRVNGKYKQVKPFLQVSTYLVTENVDFESGISENGNIFSEDGIGIGLSTGLDIKVSELISIPVEIIYIGTDGDDIDNLSGYGLSAGVSFNF